MKKLLLFFMLLGMGTPLFAQETAEQDRTQQQLDSLNQALHEMSARIDDAEQDENNRVIWKNRAKYFNISYVRQELTPDFGSTLTDAMETLGVSAKVKSDMGVALSWGKTFYLHKKPLARMIKFGIDWSWMDFNYAKYSSECYMDEYNKEYVSGSSMHQLEYGMSFGPSVTINPVHRLKISGYFRVTPSYSLLYANETLYHHYATFFNTGFAVAWNVISVGCEWRWGNAKYKGLMFDENSLSDDELEGLEDIPGLGDIFSDVKKQKFKTKSMRVYLSFRF